MKKAYSKEEIENILLSKSLDDFYFAIIENRGEILSEEELEKIKKNGVLSEDCQSEITEILEALKKNEKTDKYTDDFFKILLSFASIRKIALLTVIDDEVYDIANVEFVDLSRYKIIHFEKFTNHYNKTNARLRYFTPEEEPFIKETKLLLDVDDESIFRNYENNHIGQESDKDLTTIFLSKVSSPKFRIAGVINVFDVFPDQVCLVFVGEDKKYYLAEFDESKDRTVINRFSPIDESCYKNIRSIKLLDCKQANIQEYYQVGDMLPLALEISRDIIFMARVDKFIEYIKEYKDKLDTIKDKYLINEIDDKIEYFSLSLK